METVIVTGANGFVGSNLVLELSKLGINVIAVIRNEDSDISHIEHLEGVQIIYCEMSAIMELHNKIGCYFKEDIKIDVFYHLAWEGSSGILRSNRKVQMTNIKSTCDAVQVCELLKVRRFVFASSIMEKEIEQLIKNEKKPSIGSIYSIAKMTANYMARTLAASLEIEYIAGMISNIYGVGENTPRLINSSLRKLLRKERPSFTLGNQMYDFIYITDAAKAFVAIGNRGRADKTYYIGTLYPRPLKLFLEEMRDSVDKRLEIGLGDIEFEGVYLNYTEIDVDALNRDTEFEAQVEFTMGIRLTVEWMMENSKTV